MGSNIKEFKSAHELEAIILSEMTQYEAPEGVPFSVIRDGSSWRPSVNVANQHKVPEHAEWIAKLVQVADQLKAKFDLMD
jgi:hypothetical protein